MAPKDLPQVLSRDLHADLPDSLADNSSDIVPDSLRDTAWLMIYVILFHI